MVTDLKSRFDSSAPPWRSLADFALGMSSSSSGTTNLGLRMGLGEGLLVGLWGSKLSAGAWVGLGGAGLPLGLGVALGLRTEERDVSDIVLLYSHAFFPFKPLTRLHAKQNTNHLHMYVYTRFNVYCEQATSLQQLGATSTIGNSCTHKPAFLHITASYCWDGMINCVCGSEKGEFREEHHQHAYDRIVCYRMFWLIA